MYTFRVFNGPQLVREYDHPYSVSSYIKQTVNRHDFIVEIANTMDGDCEAIVERVTSKIWLKKNLETEYRRRIRNRRQFLQFARRRAFYRTTGKDAARMESGAIFDTDLITRETKKLLWRS
ncbi:MAG: hypothetical protein OXG53_09670 [Chloroflexi bacterium]|nr:hypothetical protein [Chloroflexota bacterium]